MLSLIATWTLQPGHEKAGLAALKRLAKKVLAEEPGTLVYLVHSPDPAMDSLPRVAPQQVVFFEVYADKRPSSPMSPARSIRASWRATRICSCAPRSPAPAARPSPRPSSTCSS
jgi:quinol monooxygenase YgiN